MPATRCACSIRARRRWRHSLRAAALRRHRRARPQLARRSRSPAFPRRRSAGPSLTARHGGACAYGADGVIGAESRHVHVEMSTIGSKTVKAIAAELAKKSIAVIDSPVSGGPRGARAGTLSTMAAGEHAAFERVKPMLQALARKVFYVGDKPGLGQVTKLANNMISAAGMLAAYECSAMAVKAGVDARTLIDTVNASTGRNATTLDKFPASILTRSFDYGGKTSIMYKDVSLALEEARDLGVPMWLGANVVEMWHMGMVEGRGEEDFTALIKMFEKWAGVVVGGNESGPAAKP